MKSYVIIICFLSLVLSCQNSTSGEVKPQKVYRIVYELRSNDWYQTQADLWKKEIDKNPQNARAWHNYYNAMRYAHFEDIDTAQKRKQLAAIITDMGEAIPDTYEYYLLSYWNKHDLKDLNLIKKAHELRPDEPEPYYPFVDYNEINGNFAETKKWLTKIYHSQDISPALLNYNYNVLMSVEPNAILITYGDNDTYPAWMLQQVHNVRPDVLVLNTSMSTIDGYLELKLRNHKIELNVSDLKKMSVTNGRFSKKLFIDNFRDRLLKAYPDVPVYYALTVYNHMLEDIKEQLYIVGLAQKYSTKRIDNTAIVKKNLENHLLLDNLKFDWYREEILGYKMMHRLNMNYMVPMIMLAEHYAQGGEIPRAREWLKFALLLAEKAENKEAIEEVQSKIINMNN